MPLPRTAPLFRRLHRSEDGVALVIVLGVAFVMTLLVTVALASASTSRTQAGIEEDYQQAIAAAQAGIDDYLHRLNLDDDYWQYSAATLPLDGNLAFTQFVPIPGPTGPTRGEFTYTADASLLTVQGTVELTSTGRAGDEQRTVRALLRRDSFLDFLYFTDKETLDPIAYRTVPAGGSRPTGAAGVTWAEENCAGRRWGTWTAPSGATRSGRATDCLEITWFTGDTVDGPFHTNDRWRTSGTPAWYGATSGSAPDPLYTSSGSGSPQYLGGAPFYQPVLQIPPSNTDIYTEADYTIGAAGCLFTGPTSLTPQSNGTLLVKSPYTKRSGSGCGTWPSTAQQTINLPTNGVVYVQNIPSSGDNATTGCPFGQGLGYPILGDVNTYGCRDGDAFVEGTLNGRLTIAAENNITITWHLRRADESGTSDDLLGLVANNLVQVYHPVDPTKSTEQEKNLKAAPNHPTARFTDPVLHAAILSVNHSFLVPRWDRGAPLGTINVYGAIAQEYRGPVGTFNRSTNTAVSGYLKNYDYDPRLQFISPPHFIDPVAAEWNVRQWVEATG